MNKRAAVLRLLLAGLALGLCLNLARLPESPGRWVGDAGRAVALERAWTESYLLAPVVPGDHISTRLFVALAEGEYRWAGQYLDRQANALRRAAARQPAGAPNDWQSTLRLIECYRLLLAHEQPAPGAGTTVCRAVSAGGP